MIAPATLAVTLSDEQLSELVRRVVEALRTAEDDQWLDVKAACEYVGCHPDTLRKAAAVGRVDYRQEGNGHKLYFQRSALDRYRAGQR